MLSNLTYYPKKRMRRLRRDVFSRRLVQESHLRPTDLIYPVFILMDRNFNATFQPIVGQTLPDPDLFSKTF